MKVSFYLVVNSGGSVKVYKNKPNLGWDEISIKQNLELPDALFQKPSLEATVIIPDDAAMPKTIDADVVADVHAAIKSATGLEVRLNVISESED